MTLEPLAPDHVDAVARLALRAWAPIFDSMAKAFPPYLFQAFWPSGWHAGQDKAVRDVCASADMKVWVAIESGRVAGFVALRFHTADKLGEIFAVARMKEAGMAIAMVETGGDPGHAPARAAYERAGFRVLPLARYFRKL